MSNLFLELGRRIKNRGIIYARITVEIRRAEISLKKTIAVADWNNNRGIVKGSSLEVKKQQLPGIVKSSACRGIKRITRQQATNFARKIKSFYLGDYFDDHTILELMEYHNKTQTSTLA